MQQQILRYSQLEKILGIDRVTIWRRIKSDPDFPRPIRLGSGKATAIGFLKNEIEEWVALQAAKRSDKAGVM